MYKVSNQFNEDLHFECNFKKIYILIIRLELKNIFINFNRIYYRDMNNNPEIARNVQNI